jgi:hypothetical protein
VEHIQRQLGHSNLGMELSDVDSNYNALQFSPTKRVGFVTAVVAYTNRRPGDRVAAR